jgi:hypothetical protein
VEKRQSNTFSAWLHSSIHYKRGESMLQRQCVLRECVRGAAPGEVFGTGRRPGTLGCCRAKHSKSHLATATNVRKAPREEVGGRTDHFLDARGCHALSEPYGQNRVEAIGELEDHAVLIAQRTFDRKLAWRTHDDRHRPYPKGTQSTARHSEP